MIVTFGNRCCRSLILGCVMLSLSGCYYMQAARGQLDVMSKREPIDELIEAPGTPEELAGRLQLVSEARQFAIDELLLPDNDSYRSYADLGRDFVVWNVFAAPEFSLQPRTWCFPIAGCVAYRGYFSEDAAHRKADQLRENGFDVAVGGIAAYSTLGRFADPVLNTMMQWDDTDLVATIFHELAHQVLYVKGDSTFNESFATAVEEIGLERWLSSRDQGDDFGDYIDRRDQRNKTLELMTAARLDLEKIYASSMAVHEKRRAKETRLAQLANELPAEFGTDLNNARLAAMSLYHHRVPEFRALYEECERELRCFFDRASSLQPAESSTPH
jgi:predicted aminopeptidase